MMLQTENGEMGVECTPDLAQVLHSVSNFEVAIAPGVQANLPDLEGPHHPHVEAAQKKPHLEAAKHPNVEAAKQHHDLEAPSHSCKRLKLAVPQEDRLHILLFGYDLVNNPVKLNCSISSKPNKSEMEMVSL